MSPVAETVRAPVAETVAPMDGVTNHEHLDTGDELPPCFDTPKRNLVRADTDTSSVDNALATEMQTSCSTTDGEPPAAGNAKKSALSPVKQKLLRDKLKLAKAQQACRITQIYICMYVMHLNSVFVVYCVVASCGAS